jgi:hypothetical protein
MGAISPEREWLVIVPVPPFLSTAFLQSSDTGQIVRGAVRALPHAV